jgi:hypothetical protein
VKLYLRELPKPLLSFELYPYFLAAGDGNGNVLIKLGQLADLLGKLPRSSFQSAALLLALLHDTSVLNPVLPAAELARLFAPLLLRRLKRDVNTELPGKTEQVLFARLSPLQRDAYARYLRSAEVAGVLDRRTSALRAITVLRKLCNHPALLDPDDWNIAGVGRLEGANSRLPTSVFRDSDARFARSFPALRVVKREPFHKWLYLASGGLRLNTHIPRPIARALVAADRALHPGDAATGLFARIVVERLPG